MAETTDNVIKTTVVLNTSQAEQQVVKLNATASDSTKSLEERLAAKNKQVEISNQLSKKTIDALNNERRTLEGKGASEKELMAIKVKLDKANLAAVKTSENNAKAQNKLADSYRNSKDPVENLDKATGGLVGKMKMFLANPIGIVLVALVGIFNLVKEAINSTEDGAASLNAVMAALGQIFTNLITFVSSVVQPVFEKLAEFLSRDLSGAFKSMGGYIDALKLGFGAVANAVTLAMTPLRTLIALAKAASLAVKGDFEGAKQVMVDFKDETVNAANAIGDKLTAALNKVGETNKAVTKSFNDTTGAGNSLVALAAQIEKRQLTLNKSKREQQLTDAKLGVQSRQALADSKDLSKSYSERFKSLQNFKKIEKEIASGRQGILQTEIKLQKDRMSLGGNQQADEEKLNELLISRETINEELANQALKFNSLSKEFDIQRKKEVSGRQSSELELERIKIERLRESHEVTLEQEKAFLTKKMNLELSNETLTTEQRKIIREKHKDDLSKLDEAELGRQRKDSSSSLELENIRLQRLRDNKTITIEEEKAFLKSKMELELEADNLTTIQKQIIAEKHKDELFALDLLEQEKKDNVIAAELEAELLKDEVDLERRRAHGDNVLLLELEISEKRREQELADLDLTEAEKLSINAKYDAIKLKNEATYLDATKKSVDEAARHGAEAAAEAFGISQELKIAEMIMAAPTAVGNSFTKAAEVYAPPVSIAMGALGAAGVIIPIIKGLADIKKARFPGAKRKGGGGSISMPSGGGGGGRSSVSSSAITDITANNSARLGVDPSLGLNAGSNAANNILGGASSNIVFSENKYNQFQNQVSFKEQKTSI
jgi:hypothetical protein